MAALTICSYLGPPKIKSDTVSTDLRDADDTTLTAESEEELKSLSMKMKEESENVGLKLNIKKTKIMASSPMTAWQKEEVKRKQ